MGDRDQQFREFIASEINEHTESGLLKVAPPSGEDGISPMYASKLVEEYLGLSAAEREDWTSFEHFVAEALNSNDAFAYVANDEEILLLEQIEDDIKEHRPELLNYFYELMESGEGTDILMMGNNYDGFVYDVPQWLNGDYQINLMLATAAERDDDLGSIPCLFPAADDKVATDKDTFIANADNALTYLIHQQGYKLADLYAAQFTNNARNAFIDSVNDELSNYSYSQGNLTALTSANGQDFISLIDGISNKDCNFVLSEKTAIGLLDGFNGATSYFDIQLDKDLIIPASMINGIQIDSKELPQKGHQWTVNQICGFDKNVWAKSTVKSTTEKPILVEEDMTETFEILNSYFHEDMVSVKRLQSDLLNFGFYELLDAAPISETANLTVLYDKFDAKVIFNIEYENDGYEYTATNAFTKDEFLKMSQNDFEVAIGQTIAYNSIELPQTETQKPKQTPTVEHEAKSIKTNNDFFDRYSCEGKLYTFAYNEDYGAYEVQSDDNRIKEFTSELAESVGLPADADRDAVATELAKADGVPIIPENELPMEFGRKYEGWLDTQENRQAIKECAIKAAEELKNAKNEVKDKANRDIER